jgi:hypothetical protein
MNLLALHGCFGCDPTNHAAEIASAQNHLFGAVLSIAA